MTTSSASSVDHRALLVVLAGVCAALHVGKLPPAITALQQELGLTLVEAGFLLSMVQLAGMVGGVALGTLADGLGPRFSMTLGLGILAVSSALGAWADGVHALLVLRSVESLGFLLVVLPAPGLLRRLLPADRLNAAMGLWGTFMPMGVALALLIGPPWIQAAGWRSWWLLAAIASAAMAVLLPRVVQAVPPSQVVQAGNRWTERLRQTLSSTGPWLIGGAFAVYSAQWLAVIGFLPAIYEQAGVSGAVAGLLSSLAAAANVVGNLVSGRRLQQGADPARLIAIGFVVMALAAVAAFAAPGSGLPPAARYGAVLLFSMSGGMIPAALFLLAVRMAPNVNAVSTTVGWVQQWSALGQFTGPPLVSWLASRLGGWHWTWAATGTMAMAGIVLAWLIARRMRA